MLNEKLIFIFLYYYYYDLDVIKLQNKTKIFQINMILI